MPLLRSTDLLDVDGVSIRLASDTNERVLWRQPDTQLWYGVHPVRLFGTGTFVATTERVLWVCTEKRAADEIAANEAANAAANAAASAAAAGTPDALRVGDGFVLDYTQISLHAISRDESLVRHAALFCQVSRAQFEENTMADDQGDAGDAGNNDEGGDDDDGDDSTAASSSSPLLVDDASEIMFVPQDASALDEMYSAMSVGASLHPDEGDEGDDGDEDDEEDGNGNGNGGGFFFTAADLAHAGAPDVDFAFHAPSDDADVYADAEEDAEEEGAEDGEDQR